MVGPARIARRPMCAHDIALVDLLSQRATRVRGSQPISGSLQVWTNLSSMAQREVR